VSWKPSSFTGRQEKRHWPGDGIGLTVGKSTGDTDVRGRTPESVDSGVKSVGPAAGATDQSEAKAVKREASSTSFERVDNHAELGCSSLTTWDA